MENEKVLDERGKKRKNRKKIRQKKMKMRDKGKTW